MTLINNSKTVFALLFFMLGAALLAPQALAQDSYDIVIANGRVMDPETGLDGVRYVGIRGGTVAAISEAPLQGKMTIDAGGW